MQYSKRITQMLFALVEIDTILHSDLDPAIGALDIQERICDESKNPLTFLDSPFFRFCYGKSGFRNLYYKPRKICLFEEAFSVVGFNADSYQQEIIRRSPDIVVIRNCVANQTRQFISDYTLRSGVGGHGPNSTAGFSLDYWIEQENSSSEDDCVIETRFCLPSAELGGLSYRPLLVAGGEATEAEFFSETNELDSADFPSGLYGVRLIDGIKYLVVDIRSSKPLSSISITPKVIRDGDSEFVPESVLRIAISGSRIKSVDSPNRIYVTVY